VLLKTKMEQASYKACWKSKDEQEKFKADLLAAHKKCRELHGLPPLKWHDKCASTAEDWALVLKTKYNGQMEHGGHKGNGPQGKDMGQNLAMNWASDDSAICLGDDATYRWYDEIIEPGYDYKKPDYQSGTGHFTQVIWKDTTHVGAARIKCGNTSLVVANYYPPGNWMGAANFRKNVPPPLSGKAKRMAEPKKRPAAGKTCTTKTYQVTTKTSGKTTKTRTSKTLPEEFKQLQIGSESSSAISTNTTTKTSTKTCGSKKVETKVVTVTRKFGNGKTQIEKKTTITTTDGNSTQVQTQTKTTTTG